MKKQLITIIISLFVATVFAFGAVACGSSESQTDSSPNESISESDGGESSSESKPEHTHNFCVENTDAKYLKSSATCQQKAIYYYSCECGEVGSGTFEYGELADHAFTQEVAEDKYLKYAATCQQKAIYYCSCLCGEKGKTMFEYGELAEHVFTQEIIADKYLASAATCTEKTKYYYSCACGTKGSTTFDFGEVVDHAFTQKVAEEKYLATSSTCTAKAKYYYSCTCGEKGSETFEYGELAKHNYATLKSDATRHWYECACGDKTGVENHIPSAAATETTAQICTKCNYVITPALGHVHTSHLTKVDAVENTCTKAGNIAYYTCSCGKWFTDNTAKTEITDKNSVILNKLNHTFNVKNIDDKYFKSVATCESAGLYYYSCVCGEKCTTTFSVGSKLGHKYCEWVSNGNGTHTKTCANDNRHTITENCNGGTATCKEKATCKDCKAKYGNLANHTYDREWNYNQTHHWQNATCGCDLKQNYAEHTIDDSGWCTFCDQSITATKGVLYEVSADGKYAEVIGYNGSSTRVRIADTYNSLPVKNIYA